MPVPHTEPGEWTETETNLLCAAVMLWGDKWKAIEELFPGKTMHQCRTHWLLNLARQRNDPKEWTDEELVNFWKVLPMLLPLFMKSNKKEESTTPKAEHKVPTDTVDIPVKL